MNKDDRVGRTFQGWQRQPPACRWFAYPPSAKPSALPLPPAWCFVSERQTMYQPRVSVPLMQTLYIPDP